MRSASYVVKQPFFLQTTFKNKVFDFFFTQNEAQRQESKRRSYNFHYRSPESFWLNT
jgi:hypothetical protein